MAPKKAGAQATSDLSATSARPIAALRRDTVDEACGDELDNTPFAPQTPSFMLPSPSPTSAPRTAPTFDHLDDCNRRQSIATHHQAKTTNGLREAQHTQWPHESCSKKSTKSAPRNALGR